VPADETRLDDRERRHAAALMRVNHVGEVCARRITARPWPTRDKALRAPFEASRFGNRPPRLDCGPPGRTR
jgi:ubiquinone biosynthesis monooxygenase Coq7